MLLMRTILLLHAAAKYATILSEGSGLMHSLIEHCYRLRY